MPENISTSITMWVLYIEIPMNFQVWGKKKKKKEANIKGIIHSKYEIVSLSTFKFKPCRTAAQSPFTSVKTV